jgi:phosphohistidine phosphatase
MELYIVRHGIAIDREDPQSPADPERFLTEEGTEKTQQVAKSIAALGVTPDLFVSSPYVRAMQTAEIFADVLEYPKPKIRQSNALLPGAEPSLFFRELAKDKQSAIVFCFGHAPHVDSLIAAGVGVRHPITAMKKAGVTLLELRRLSPPSGQLVWVVTPKLLRRTVK